MTRPASHQLERGRGPTACHLRHAGEGEKCFAPEFACCASAFSLLLSVFGKGFHRTGLSQGARKAPS